MCAHWVLGAREREREKIADAQDTGRAAGVRVHGGRGRGRRCKGNAHTLIRFVGARVCRGRRLVF